VEGFDLCLNQIWFGSSNESKMQHEKTASIQVYNDQVAEDCLNRVLRLNVDTLEVRNMDFDEWMRTLTRCHKYITRGFGLFFHANCDMWSHVAMQWFHEPRFLEYRLCTWNRAVASWKDTEHVPQFVVTCCIEPSSPETTTVTTPPSAVVPESKQENASEDGVLPECEEATNVMVKIYLHFFMSQNDSNTRRKRHLYQMCHSEMTHVYPRLQWRLSFDREETRGFQHLFMINSFFAVSFKTYRRTATEHYLEEDAENNIALLYSTTRCHSVCWTTRERLFTPLTNLPEDVNDIAPDVTCVEPIAGCRLFIDETNLRWMKESEYCRFHVLVRFYQNDTHPPIIVLKGVSVFCV